MLFNEFIDLIKNKCERLLAQDDLLTIQKKSRENNVYTAVVVSSDTYGDYELDVTALYIEVAALSKRAIEEISDTRVKNFLDARIEKESPKEEIEYEYNPAGVYISACNIVTEEVLNDAFVYKMYGDIAVIFKCDTYTEKGVLVTPNLMEKWNISKKQLLEDAVNNAMSSLGKITTVEERICGATVPLCMSSGFIHSDMYADRCLLFYPGELERLAEKVNGNLIIGFGDMPIYVIAQEMPGAVERISKVLGNQGISKHTYKYDKDTKTFAAVESARVSSIESR